MKGGLFKMIKPLEIYDSLNPKNLLEIRFVLGNGITGEFFDNTSRHEGYSLTGKTFRASYRSLRGYLLKDNEFPEKDPAG